MIELTVPWPDKDLFPNRKNGMHWGSYQKKKEAARYAGYIAAAGHSVTMGDSKGGVSLEIVFFAPDARSRDLDGMLGAIKNTIDGVCAGLGIDDKCFDPVILRRGKDPAKKGYVTLTIG